MIAHPENPRNDERIDDRSDDLEELRRAVRQNCVWTLVLVCLFILQGAGFLTYGYWRYKQAIEPKKLVATAEQVIEDNYQDVRSAVEKQLAASAPKIADTLSRRAVRNIPEARERLEGIIIGQLDLLLDESTEFSAEQFRKILRNNRRLVLDGYRELKEAPKEAEKFVLDLEQSIEKQFDVDLRRLARNTVNAQRALNDKLQRLTQSDSLSSTELVERRIARLLRTMQIRAAARIDQLL